MKDCPQWPVADGGLGLDHAAAMALADERERAGAPPFPAGLGETLVGPLVVAAGDPAQRARLLPRIRAGADTYCLAFTEAAAGSDLSAVATTATGPRVTGEKTWVRGTANRALVLCDGTLAIVDLDQPGVRRDGDTLRLDAARAEPLGPARPLLDTVEPALVPVLSRRGRRARRGADALTDLARKVGRERDPGVRRTVAAVHAGVAVLRAHHRRMDTGRAALATERILYAAHRRALAEAAFGLLGADGLGDGTGWHRLVLEAGTASVAGGAEEAVRDAVAGELFGLPHSGFPLWRALVEEAAAP